MNDNYLYLYAEAPLLEEPSDTNHRRSIIGDFDTRSPEVEPNEDEAVFLSLI